MDVSVEKENYYRKRVLSQIEIEELMMKKFQQLETYVKEQ